MKFYIKSDSTKPFLSSVKTTWKEFSDGSGIVFTVLSDRNKLLYEAVFDYDDVDSDAIYGSAIEMAILALSQQYELSDLAISQITGDEEKDI